MLNSGMLWSTTIDGYLYQMLYDGGNGVGMALATDTPLGQKYKEAELRVISRIENVMGWSAVVSGKAGTTDALFHVDGELVEAGEVKCRKMTIDRLHKWGSYMISASKIKRGRYLARALGVPFGIWTTAYLSPGSPIILFWPVCDEDGKYREELLDQYGEIRQKERETQYDIYGGKKIDQVVEMPITMYEKLT